DALEGHEEAAHRWATLARAVAGSAAGATGGPRPRRWLIPDSRALGGTPDQAGRRTRPKQVPVVPARTRVANQRRCGGSPVGAGIGINHLACAAAMRTLVTGGSGFIGSNLVDT